ncbi:MAG: hypothetical protein ACK53L_04165, partial [Pirellulaceae bacterium]
MDLQQRTGRRSRHSSRRRSRRVPLWTPIFLCRLCALVAIVASPWFLGSANWQEQIYLTLLMILAGGLMLAEWGQRWWVG